MAQDMTDYSLKQIAEVLNNPNSSQDDVDNAFYEIGYREDLATFAAKGGIHPTHQPPH